MLIQSTELLLVFPFCLGFPGGSNRLGRSFPSQRRTLHASRMGHSPLPFCRLLIPSAVIASLLAFTGPGLAQTSQEKLKKAETVCVESAGKEGWRPDLAKVVSSKAIDADKVEVVLDLTKDGTNTARLTCPYSVSKGVGKFGDNFAKSMATTVSKSNELDRTRIWFVLLPLGLAVISWNVLRSREEAA